MIFFFKSCLACVCLWVWVFVCVYVLSFYEQDLALYKHFNYYYYVHTLYKRQRGNYKKNLSHCFSAVYAFQTRHCLHSKQAQTTLKVFLFIFTALWPWNWPLKLIQTDTEFKSLLTVKMYFLPWTHAQVTKDTTVSVCIGMKSLNSTGTQSNQSNTI